MQLKKVVEGKHNKVNFRYENGMLIMFDRKWDRDDIRTLIETANLLQHEGYSLKIPTGSHQREVYSMFGGNYVVDEKEYDEREGD